MQRRTHQSATPDAVLSSILANLTVIDAVRTSILSRRWKRLFSSMPALNFSCLDMYGVYRDDHEWYPYYQQKFLKGVNELLELYSGRRVPCINMACCFARKFYSEFNRLMHSISRLDVETLYLYFDCGTAPFTLGTNPICDPSKLFNFSLELLSQASSLKHLLLHHCIVQPSSEVCFNSLVSLTLRGALLASGQLEGILSSCFNLKLLALRLCKLPYKLRISGSVTFVVFWACGGVEEIELQGANLRKLESELFNKVRFFFSFVPVLEDVIIHPLEDDTVSYVFDDLARDLPAQVQSLTIKLVPSQVNYFPTEMKMFRTLRRLSLILVSTHDCFDIVNLSPLLDACPLLQYLALVVTTPRTKRNGKGSREPPLSPTCHTELKEVIFCGFDGTGSEIEFVLYILRSAINLEQMLLGRGNSCYLGCGKWVNNLDVPFSGRQRNSIQKKLHGQAISSKAEVIIQ
ncbi:PREDICTED: putative F-box/FBD/LRR-repeat protein At5g22670 isoform X2 [Nicotiana attenuata]|uniref:F-boxfbd/lrr-repeat protein n=2 Tax=Nicotiana attenuata TaxID=49451 RepID=A0A314KW22_NICAT|nr:PREDICTED: putative F-box/FBD/LRR-repeat protein At5g22670 isoform X2 [Nicotiana attenuata]OIT33207.1 hypothetical protein A4A49_07229 [Nicotiana attenuata]